MKVKELIEFMGNGKNRVLKISQLQEVLKNKLEVKDYISIKEKKQIVDNIVNSCILYEDGIFKFDDAEKYVHFIMKTINAYTNLELSDDIEEDYDMLCREKILEIVIGTFKKEYDEVNILLQMKCDYILYSNSVEAQMGKFLNNISEKVDLLVNTVSSKVNGLDFSKLPIDKKDLIKLIDFIDNQK